ncbi:hypothetical protein V6N13_052936 [Hibiscus sabdariffa]
MNERVFAIEMAFPPHAFMFQTLHQYQNRYHLPSPYSLTSLLSSPPQLFHGAGKLEEVLHGGHGNGDDELSDEGSNHGEKKKRLKKEQVRALENSFELGNKLDPEKKLRLSKELGLKPRHLVPKQEGKIVVGMEIFQKASVVRLCSHHDKFLVANEDQETVGQDRDGTSMNARWTVEFPESSSIHIRLKSCHGKYLTASNMPFLIGLRGKKVLQTLPRRLTSSVEWEPVMEGVQIRLRTRYGQYLRANGKFPPWRGHITHDVPYRSATQEWILWNVEILEHRHEEALPRLLPPAETSSSSWQPPINENGIDTNHFLSCE